MSEIDEEFLRAMIAHHEAALEMSRAYLERSPAQRQARVSELARAIISAQEREIAQMRSWLPGRASTERARHSM